MSSYARALEHLRLNMSLELSMACEAAEKAREGKELAGAREEADLKLKASVGLLSTARKSVDLKLSGLKLSSAFTIGLLILLFS